MDKVALPGIFTNGSMGMKYVIYFIKKYYLFSVLQAASDINYCYCLNDNFESNIFFSRLFFPVTILSFLPLS